MRGYSYTIKRGISSISSLRYCSNRRNLSAADRSKIFNCVFFSRAYSSGCRWSFNRSSLRLQWCNSSNDCSWPCFFMLVLSSEFMI